MNRILMILLTVLFLLSPRLTSADEKMTAHTITTGLDLVNHRLKGVSKITLPAGKTTTVDVSGLKVLSASINGMPLRTGPDTEVITFEASASDDTVQIEYEAAFSPPSGPDNGEKPGIVQSNLIGPEGAVLTAGWYPYTPGLSLYSLSVNIPAGFEAISEAEEIRVIEETDGTREFHFSFDHPLGNISLIAGKYAVEKETRNGTDIYTYFFPEDASLAKTYMEHTGKYLDMYEALLGKYPFRRFSVVENILPTGHALPTFTLLGKDVVRLPFIVETSLGHEILHQWFGALVSVSAAGGNWSEGLTAYLADHRYEEIKGSGSDHRKQLLISLQSYVFPENDFPLSAFSGRTGKVTEAVGYGRAAMVFHMLRNLVGEDQFYTSLRTLVEKYRFRQAAWDDIRILFEAASGKDLGWFFNQWLEEKGAPDFQLKNVELDYKGPKAVVSFEVLQKGIPRRVKLPVSVKSEKGETKKIFDLEKETTSLEIELEDTPLELVIDEDYDLLRRLGEREFPPVISRLFGDPMRIFVIPRGKEKAYAAVSEDLKAAGFTGKKEEEIQYEDIKSSSLLIPEADTGLTERLFGKTERQQNDFSLRVRENPFNRKGVVAIADGAALPGIEEYMRKAARYGKYSLLIFKNGKNILKTAEESQAGLRAKMAGEVLGLEVPRLVNVQEVTARVAGKKIIYVGEAHDRFEHHRVQFEILKGLHRKNGRIAIGMEMFQEPFQKVLDDYIAGTIEEREFLKKTEYFKRWVFDYTLYREILLYAREYRIPVIALNIRKEIVSKVSREGLLALSGDDLKEVPGDMDLSDGEYRARLRDIFQTHRGSADRTFDFFYQSQVLWDEAMAHNLDKFIRNNPEHQLIVFAGIGHMSFGSGIPKRAYRLNGMDHSIILNSDEVGENIADFVLFPETLKPRETPRLMVQLKEEEGRVKIAEFSPNSISEKAGLKKDDVLLSLDDTKIEGIDDIRIFLLYKKKGDEVTLTVERRRFILGPAELKFRITI